MDIDEALRLLSRQDDMLLESIREAKQAVARLEDFVHAELSDLRDGLIDLDHKHAATRQVLNSLQEDGA